MSNFVNIPEELKQMKHWVLWRLESGKKIPYQITRSKASTTNPAAWTTYNKALECYNHSGGRYNGLGFVFTNSGITGIDIDDCIENGKISKEAQTVIDGLNSYTEKSQSSLGIHVLVKGTIPKAVKTKQIELYNTARYFALTGDTIQGTQVEQRQLQLDELYKKYAPAEVQDSIERVDIDDLLERAFHSVKGFKIKALYDGEWQELYSSQSNADQALCDYLAFWLDKDFNAIDEAFQSSALYRPKWDREDYKSWTINKAIQGCKKSYQELLKEKDLPKGRDIKFAPLGDSLVTSPVRKYDFIINRLLYDEAINLVSGDPKTYKTFCAIDIAIGVAAGGTALGHQVMKTGKVLFISTEFDVRNRFVELVKGKGLDTKILNNIIPFIYDESLDTFQWKKDFDLLQQLLEEHRPKLVVIDPLTFIFDGDINKNDEVGQFFKELKALIKKFGFSVLLVHHNNRMSETKKLITLVVPVL